MKCRSMEPPAKFAGLCESHQPRPTTIPSELLGLAAALGLAAGFATAGARFGAGWLVAWLVAWPAACAKAAMRSEDDAAAGGAGAGAAAALRAAFAAPAKNFALEPALGSLPRLTVGPAGGGGARFATRTVTSPPRVTVGAADGDEARRGGTGAGAGAGAGRGAGGAVACFARALAACAKKFSGLWEKSVGSPPIVTVG